MSRNNQNFKRLCAALKLTRNDVAEILQGAVSKSQIDGWMRGESSRKNATGSSRADTVARFRPMSDEHFDQFCAALVDWLKPVNEADNG